MVRISTNLDEETLRVKVEGRLVGRWVDELRSVIFQSGAHSSIEIDLTEVTFVDEKGEHLLAWIHRLGGQFRCSGAFSEFLCKRLGIPTIQPVRRTGTKH
jgi:hypothetical protein